MKNIPGVGAGFAQSFALASYAMAKPALTGSLVP